MSVPRSVLGPIDVVGSFRRSLTDARRVTMRGKIYRVGGFWKRRVLIGHFKGYRRQ